ncbi:unnamed protein product, partial [Prorocentrum cordatum]
MAAVTATVYDRMMAPAGCPPVEARVKAGKACDDRSQEPRQAAKNGDEAAYADEEMQDLVRGALAEVSKLELREMGQLVRVFKLEVHKPQEGVQKMAHFTWALDHSHYAADDLNATIHSLFTKAGGT